jgi:hypothetical protein
MLERPWRWSEVAAGSAKVGRNDPCEVDPVF